MFSALGDPCCDGGHKPYKGEDVSNPPGVTISSVVQWSREGPGTPALLGGLVVVHSVHY